MQTIAQSSTDDMTLDANGVIKMNDGLSAYRDIVLDNVRTQLGEIQLDTTIGIDYLNTIFSSVSNIDEWEQLVLSSVSKLSFVRSVDFLEASIEDGVFKYTISVVTDLGTTTVSGIWSK